MLKTASRNIVNRIRGDVAFASPKTKRPTPNAAAEQQGDIEPTELAAPDRHGKRIGRECQSQQQRAEFVEAAQVSLRRTMIDGQTTMGQKQSETIRAAR